MDKVMYRVYCGDRRDEGKPVDPEGYSPIETDLMVAESVKNILRFLTSFDEVVVEESVDGKSWTVREDEFSG